MSVVATSISSYYDRSLRESVTLQKVCIESPAELRFNTKRAARARAKNQPGFR